LQDRAAVSAILEEGKYSPFGSLDESSRARLVAFNSDSSEEWAFRPELWKLPVDSGANRPKQARAGLQKTDIDVDPEGRSRGEFLAYLACGDRSPSGYLAQGVINRVLRAKIQIDLGQFCKTFNSIPSEQCTVRANLQEHLPERIQNNLKQVKDCYFKIGSSAE
jgi:hypothetical protein